MFISFKVDLIEEVLNFHFRKNKMLNNPEVSLCFKKLIFTHFPLEVFQKYLMLVCSIGPIIISFQYSSLLGKQNKLNQNIHQCVSVQGPRGLEEAESSVRMGPEAEWEALTAVEIESHRNSAEAAAELPST